jgi:dienelactone hydrolase
MALALTTRSVRLVGRWPRPLPILLRFFLNTATLSFIFAAGARVYPADQGPFTQDLLKQAEAKGADARKQLHYQLITGSQLDDALAGLTFLKAAPDVDPTRIAIVGHSFGGMLTLFSGDHDSTIRAEVAFAAGANSWHASQELRDRTFAAVGKTAAPIMLLYAANDFDTTPGKDISAELDRLHKSHLLKIYPAIGKISDDGHNLLYLGIPEWEPDVFQFLDDNVKH